MWTGENGGSASLCGRVKTEVFENDYVTGIGMSQLKKQNGCFLIRFRWCSVDGRKRYKNASVDEKLFIRFQETENGGFRKRISVDRALIACTCTGENYNVEVSLITLFLTKIVLLKGQEFCSFCLVSFMDRLLLKYSKEEGVKVAIIYCLEQCDTSLYHSRT